MISTLIGIKKDMSHRFNERGHRMAVSIIRVEPNTIFITKDNRFQLTLSPRKKPKNPEKSYVSTLGFAPKIKRQIKISEQEKQDIKTGDKITVSVFKPQDLVRVTGITRGKGFAGTVKRWGFHGGPKTHGQSDRHRAPGSIGQTTTPGRVYKGKHMAGHMGAALHTVTNLEVIAVDPDKNQLVVKGAVPGATNGFLVIEKTAHAKSYTPPPPPSEEKQEEKAAIAEPNEPGTSLNKNKSQLKEEEQK